MQQIEIYKYTYKILIILLCVFVYSPKKTKTLFGPNKYYTHKTVLKVKNIHRYGKQSFVNLCICVQANKIAALGGLKIHKFVSTYFYVIVQFSFLIRPRRCSLALIQHASPQSHVSTGTTDVDGSDDDDDVGILSHATNANLRSQKLSMRICICCMRKSLQV